MVAGQDVFSMFEAALGLVAPWQVSSVEFDKDAGELQIGLGFPRGSRFSCPVQVSLPQKPWRHALRCGFACATSSADRSGRRRMGRGRSGRVCFLMWLRWRRSGLGV